MAILQDYINRVNQLMPQPQVELEDRYSSVDACVDAAVSLYSRIKPRTLIASLAGTGVAYEYALPVTFTDLSHIKRVEFPSGEQTPVVIGYDKYAVILQTDASYKIRLATTPSSAETVLVHYTAAQLVTTISTSDFEAVCHAACYYLASQMAAFYAFKFKPNIDASYINFRTKSDEFRNLADMFLTNFKLYLGMKRADTVPAAAIYAYVG
jgi:hypothetical protein